MKAPIQIPNNMRRPPINMEATAKPAAGKTGLTVPGSIVMRKLILERKKYKTATTTTLREVELKEEDFE